jgi:SAM-dependent methyltransferase
VLDYGCGTGRFIRFFGARGCRVIGTDITPQMFDEPHRIGLPPGCSVQLGDGSSIQLPDASIDMVWVSGVLRYSLFEPGAPCRGGGPEVRGDSAAKAITESNPPYALLAAEMFRTLRPGGIVAILEMYVDSPPSVFIHDFERAGFQTESVRLLQR